MPKRLIFALLLIAATASAALAAPQGLISKKSPFDVGETLDRLETILEEKGLAVIARIDLTESAGEIGETLRPTELLLFSDPARELQLLRSDQRVGIDLPLKALAWEDRNGRVFLTYTKPEYMVRRFRLTNRPVVIKRLAEMLDEITSAAVSP